MKVVGSGQERPLLHASGNVRAHASTSNAKHQHVPDNATTARARYVFTTSTTPIPSRKHYALQEEEMRMPLTHNAHLQRIFGQAGSKTKKNNKVPTPNRKNQRRRSVKGPRKNGHQMRHSAEPAPQIPLSKSRNYTKEKVLAQQQSSKILQERRTTQQEPSCAQEQVSETSQQQRRTEREPSYLREPTCAREQNSQISQQQWCTRREPSCPQEPSCAREQSSECARKRLSNEREANRMWDQICKTLQQRRTQRDQSCLSRESKPTTRDPSATAEATEPTLTLPVPVRRTPLWAETSYAGNESRLQADAEERRLKQEEEKRLKEEEEERRRQEEKERKSVKEEEEIQVWESQKEIAWKLQEAEMYLRWEKDWDKLEEMRQEREEKEYERIKAETITGNRLCGLWKKKKSAEQMSEDEMRAEAARRVAQKDEEMRQKYEMLGQSSYRLSPPPSRVDPLTKATPGTVTDDQLRKALAQMNSLNAERKEQRRRP